MQDKRGEMDDVLKSIAELEQESLVNKAKDESNRLNELRRIELEYKIREREIEQLHQTTDVKRASIQFLLYRLYGTN